MTHSVLYDEDILEWSERQAEIIRMLGRSVRNLPNELDIENVAEEIESVGRSELAAVESQLQNILVYLLKIAADPDSDAVRHWRAEIVAFHGEMQRRYAPSMRQRIDLAKLWGVARKLTILAAADTQTAEASVPVDCPLRLDELLVEDLDGVRLAHRIRNAARVAG
jgi:hypothetical protein